MRRIRGRMTYANVVASLALFIALATGGAYAADQIGTAGIKDDAVTADKISPKAFEAGDISRQGGEFEINRLAIGASELGKIKTVTKTVEVPAIQGNDAGEANATATCNGLALAGGVTFGSSADQHQQIINSFRRSERSWTATGANYFTEPTTMRVTAYCLPKNG